MDEASDRKRVLENLGEKRAMTRQIRIGADVGGTFTDVVLIDGDGGLWSHKVPSTQPDFERAVLDGIRYLLGKAGADGGEVGEVSHGTTLATNAVLEKRGAKTALVTTRGFRDVLELRRIRAPQLYDLFFEKPPPLIERCFRFEIGERVGADGEVLSNVDPLELDQLKRDLLAAEVESAAVCFLHAYAYPQHEKIVRRFLSKELPDLQVSLSSEVLPERREYERTATTAVNAYVRPVMQGYLTDLRSGLDAQHIRGPLLIMQSSGGLASERETAQRPVFMLESGPAAGVLAAKLTASQMGLQNVITLDMGGTTAKASIIEGGEISYSPQYEVGASLSSSSRLVGGGGEIVRAPTIDIAEVGAGGGSIAYLDSADGLHVGPRSAGAIPGPACYQQGGTEPTLTDANAVLGFIRPGSLADGQVRVDPETARRVIVDRIAAPMGLDLLAAADGIHRIANARTMRALREVSTERGRDPRNFVLMAFGGAGPIHAAHLASDLNIDRVVVPSLPGLFSALGLLFSGVEHHEVVSCPISRDPTSPAILEDLRREITNRLLKRFRKEGYSADSVQLHYSVDARFHGQTSELRIPSFAETFTSSNLQRITDDFLQEHERLYGHRSDSASVMEIVAIRLIGRIEVQHQEGAIGRTEWDESGGSMRDAYFGPAWGTITTPVVSRASLDGTAGPLLIDEYDSTVVVPPEHTARVDEKMNIHIEPCHA